MADNSSRNGRKNRKARQGKGDKQLTDVQRQVLADYRRLQSDAAEEGDESEGQAPPVIPPERIIGGIPDEMLLVPPLGANLHLSTLVDHQISTTMWIIWATAEGMPRWKVALLDVRQIADSAHDHMHLTRRLNTELMLIQLSSAEVAMNHFEQEVSEDVTEREVLRKFHEELPAEGETIQ